MNHKFLDHYEAELRFIRELASEFAQRFPKVSGRLGLAAHSTDDPHVERLLQGFAFTASRVHMGLDAEFPALTQPLLDVAYRNYLAPTPSMAVVQFNVAPQNSALGEGFTIARDTVLSARGADRGQTSCEFRTGHSVELLPISVESVTYTSTLRDIADLRVPTLKPIRALLKIGLRSHNMRFERLRISSLPLFVRGRDEISARLHEQLVTSTSAVVLRWGPHPVRDTALSSAARPVRALGFDAEQALLPSVPEALEGYRLLQEYFACPARFDFVELTGLAQGVERCKSERLELIVVLSHVDPALEHAVNSDRLLLFATPVINLFPRDTARIAAARPDQELHVIADPTRPRDFEVHSVTRVSAHLAQGNGVVDVKPRHRAQLEADETSLRFSVKRQKLPISVHAMPTSTYTASDVFLSLSDQSGAPAQNVRSLSLQVLCTNGDLPQTLALGHGSSRFEFRSGVPADAVRCIVAPTPARAAPLDGESVWRFLNYLSLNYLALSAQTGGVDALRDMLGLFAQFGDPAFNRQIEGIRDLRAAPAIGPFPAPGARSFVRGLEFRIECEEHAFGVHGPFILAAVLSRVFARHAYSNSFSQTVLATRERGEVHRWPALPGLRQLL